MHISLKKLLMLVLLILSFALLDVGLVNAVRDKDLVAAEFIVTTNRFSLQGPVVVFLTITNLSSKPLDVSWREWDFNISAVRRADEAATRSISHSDGVSVTIKAPEIINPHDVYRRPILLDEYSLFDSPGQYDVHCATVLMLEIYDVEDPRRTRFLTSMPVSNTLSLTLIDGDDPNVTNILAELVALAKDVNNPNNWITARTFSKIRHPAAIPYFVELFDTDRRVPVWLYGIKGLAGIGTPDAVKTLIDIPDTVPDDPAVRRLYMQETIRELKELLKMTTDIAVLIEMLNAEDASLRYEILCRLRDKGDRQCFEFAEQMLSDPNPEIRSVAEKFIQESANHQQSSND